MDEALLKKYLDDDSAFIDYFQELPYIKGFNALIEKLKAECHLLAKENLSLEKKIILSKSTLMQCESDLAPVLLEYEQLREKQEQFISKHGSHAMIYRLKQLSVQNEQECIELARQSQLSTDSLELFIDKFKEKRRQIHQRSDKIEQLSQFHT